MEKNATPIIGNILYADPFPETVTESELIGIHFSQFNGCFYVGNERKKWQYPGDEQFNINYFNEMWGN